MIAVWESCFPAASVVAIPISFNARVLPSFALMMASAAVATDTPL